MSWSKGQYLLLETTGRISGKVHRVVLRYVIAGDNVMVFPENRGTQDWFRNIQANPRVKVVFDDRVYGATATTKHVKDLRDPVLSIFTRKYGTSIVRHRYWGQRNYAILTLNQPLEKMDLEEVIYSELEAAFDAIADEYDHHIYGNPMNEWLRKVSVAFMSGIFKPGETILDFGCGTGTETLCLAEKGVKIVACDISNKMLQVLNRKAKEANLSDNVFTIQCNPSNLLESLKHAGITTLDGAYCTYGAFNTDPEPRRFAKNLHQLIKQRGRLVLGVWNKYDLIETVGYMIRGRPALALARWRNPVPVGKSRFCVTSYAYSPHEVRAILKPYFKQLNLTGTEIFLPPSNLTRYLPHGSALKLLEKLDLNAGKAFPFNRVGDHFLGEYIRE